MLVLRDEAAEGEVLQRLTLSDQVWWDHEEGLLHDLGSELLRVRLRLAERHHVLGLHWLSLQLRLRMELLGLLRQLQR